MLPESKSLLLNLKSADLGGRVGWLPKAESENPLPLGVQPLAGRAPSPGGPGPKPPGDLAHRPLGPGSHHFLQAEFLTSCCVSNHGSGLKTQGCYHNPQSADLGGRWMVAEGGALQFHENGVPVFAPAFQPLGRAPSSGEPCIPAA